MQACSRTASGARRSSPGQASGHAVQPRTSGSHNGSVHMVQLPARRMTVCTGALPAVAIMPPPAMELVAARVQEELVVDSVLHTPGISSASCQALHGLVHLSAPPLATVTSGEEGVPEAPAAPGPSSAALSAASTASGPSGGGSAGSGPSGGGGPLGTPRAMVLETSASGDLGDLAACLATPVGDPNESTANRVRLATATGVRSAQEVVGVVDRWSTWVLRVRRQRRLEHITGVLTVLTASCPGARQAAPGAPKQWGWNA